MAEEKDLLDQFLHLTPSRREAMAVHLYREFPFLFPPRIFVELRHPDFPSIVSTPNVCGGSPRLIRTRIPVWVLERMRQVGFPESKILLSYPTLTAGDLVQVWGYVAMHKTQIDKEIEENERE